MIPGDGVWKLRIGIETLLKQNGETIKFENDQYEVTWPWKMENILLPDNYQVAFERMSQIKYFKWIVIYYVAMIILSNSSCSKELVSYRYYQSFNNTIYLSPSNKRKNNHMIVSSCDLRLISLYPDLQYYPVCFDCFRIISQY